MLHPADVVSLDEKFPFSKMGRNTVSRMQRNLCRALSVHHASRSGRGLPSLHRGKHVSN